MPLALLELQLKLELQQVDDLSPSLIHVLSVLNPEERRKSSVLACDTFMLSLKYIAQNLHHDHQG